MARKSNTQSLGEAIEEFLANYKHRVKIEEAEIINAWPVVMGFNISQLTTNVYFNNGTLYVQLKSAPLRQELAMQRSRIVKLINEHLGGDHVKEVVLR